MVLRMLALSPRNVFSTPAGQKGLATVAKNARGKATEGDLEEVDRWELGTPGRLLLLLGVPLT